jgi:hypothetical protein
MGLVIKEQTKYGKSFSNIKSVLFLCIFLLKLQIKLQSLFLFRLGQNFCSFITQGSAKGEKCYKIRFWQIIFDLTGRYRKLLNAKHYNLQPTSHQILLAQSMTLRRTKHEAHVGKKWKKNTYLDWVNRFAGRVSGNKRFINGWWRNIELDLKKKKVASVNWIQKTQDRRIVIILVVSKKTWKIYPTRQNAVCTPRGALL